MRERFGGKVDEGKLVLDEPARWRGAVARHAGKRVTVTLERERKNRSLAQNRWWWGQLIPIFSEYTGYEKDEAHEMLKTIFLPTEKVLPSGEVVTIPGSTRRLTTVEHSALAERICRWLAEQGCYVPPPGAKVEVAL